VGWGDLVKGYEYERGKFVVLTKEDIEAAALEKTSTVDILDFVDAVEVDDRFFETPYYVLPGRGGERAYAVLREAMRQAGKLGVAKIILRERQHLAALEAIDQALVLTMMRFPDELVDLSSFHFPPSQLGRPQELGLAKTLIDQLSGPWSPDKYTDEYQDNVMRLIRARLKGQAPSLKEEAPDPRQAQVVDLMERLQKSLGGTRASARGSKDRRSASPSRSAPARKTRRHRVA
jgi:DNA end-binding protein Ku